MHRLPTILQPWRGDIKQRSGCHIHPKKPRCQLKHTSLPPAFVSLPLSVPSACSALFFHISRDSQDHICIQDGTLCLAAVSQCHTLTSSCVFLQVKGAVLCNRIKDYSNIRKSSDLRHSVPMDGRKVHLGLRETQEHWTNDKIPSLELFFVLIRNSLV